MIYKYRFLNELNKYDIYINYSDFINHFFKQRKWKLPPSVIRQSINELIANGYIHSNSRYDFELSAIQISPSGKNYLNEVRKKTREVWLPVAISTLLAAISIIISLLN